MPWKTRGIEDGQPMSLDCKAKAEIKGGMIQVSGSKTVGMETR